MEMLFPITLLWFYFSVKWLPLSAKSLPFASHSFLFFHQRFVVLSDGIIGVSTGLPLERAFDTLVGPPKLGPGRLYRLALWPLLLLLMPRTNLRERVCLLGHPVLNWLQLSGRLILFITTRGVPRCEAVFVARTHANATAFALLPMWLDGRMLLLRLLSWRRLMTSFIK